MSDSILFASSVGMGRRSESTEGGGKSVGEVGREVLRFARRLLLGFLSLTATAGVFVSGGLESTVVRYGVVSGTRGGGRMSLSINGCEAAEENDPTLCRISVGGFVDAGRSASASSNVRVRGLGPPR
jgi:hypothetical protein